MASQTCDQCGATVASDEQFCPSCGSFIDPMKAPRPAPRPRGRSGSRSGNVISVTSDGPGNKGNEGPYEEFSLEERPPVDEPRPTAPTSPPKGGNGRGGTVACPSCGAINPGNNRHCQECGARLQQGPLPTAPRPAVQATAGVRAALAISGLLLGVILIALLFNAFTGDDPVAEESTTSAPTTTLPIAEATEIDVLSETCDPAGIGSFVCANLTSGGTDEYQVNWPENSDEGIKITLTFNVPMAITEIQWRNIADPTRFRQNYRARALSIVAQDSLTEVPVELQDQAGLQIVRYTALNTTTLEITIVDAYIAEVVDNNTYDELAVDEIIVIGRPVTTTNTAPAETTSTTTP